MRGRRSKPKDSPTPLPEEITPPPEETPPPPVEEAASSAMDETTPWDMVFSPLDGGKVGVTLKRGEERMNAMVTKANIMAEGAKVGLGPPTPQTPVAEDRHTG